MSGLKKICIHWTAGPYQMTTLDWQHYHYTVGHDGTVVNGLHPVEANIPNPTLRNGRYAAHCGGGNSYCIGVSLRGMAGYAGPGNVGKFPLTEKQCEATWEFIAKLCKKHLIPITPDTVFTHYEFARRNPQSDSAGKIDITFLPHRPDLKPEQVGNYIRNKIAWYLGKV